MTKKNNGILVDGLITKVLPGANFNVEVKGKHLVNAYVCGKMRMNFVRIMPGDRVSLKLNPYDLSKGIIVFRYRN